MAWGNLKLEEQRFKAMLAYENGHYTVVEICKEFSISRPTFYKWHDRYLKNQTEGLKDLSKAPHDPFTIYTQEQKDLAISYKLQHRAWGPKKIVALLKEEYPDQNWPSPTHLYDIFKDLHLVNARKARRRVPATAPLGHLIGKLLSPGAVCQYVYDMGSSTELEIQVLAEVNACQKNQVTLLMRNDPPTLSCKSCKKSASVICSLCGDQTCAPCISTHMCIVDEGDDYMLLPIVNSPRAGVCAYEGA